MTEEVRTCPLCGSIRSKLFDQREFRGKPIINRLCQDCGLVYQSPRMTPAETDSFYAGEYRMLYEKSPSPTQRNLADQLKRAEFLYKFVKPKVKEIKRHLDIGCSSGTLLLRFHKDYQDDPTGIEPGDGHRQQAREYGLNVVASLQQLEQENEPRFDLVSLVHVLEHMPDPVGYLSHIREKLLEPTGYLLLEVPNLYAHDSFEIAHLLSFSPYTFIMTVKKAGYEIVKFEKHGKPRSALLPLYLTLLARPHVQKVKLHPETAVSFKREAGMFRRHVLEHLLPRLAWRS
jgi:SAM-dependent methyltransferase